MHVLETSGRRVEIMSNSREIFFPLLFFLEILFVEKKGNDWYDIFSSIFVGVGHTYKVITAQQNLGLV